MSRELVELFETESINHGLAIEEGNSRKANKAYKAIHKSYLALKENNSLNELVGLLEHESPFVKLWTARYMLQAETIKAEKVLIELGKLKGISVAFDARMTLSEWREGNLKF